MPTAAEREEPRPSIIGFVVDRVREIDPSAAALRALRPTVPRWLHVPLRKQPRPCWHCLPTESHCVRTLRREAKFGVATPPPLND